MELHACNGQAVTLYSLDGTIRGSCADTKSRCQLLYRLMVEAIHLYSILSQLSVESRVTLHDYAVMGVTMMQTGVGVFTWQVLIESTTQKHVKDLNTTTDAKHWFAQAYCLGQYTVFKIVTFQINIS